MAFGNLTERDVKLGDGSPQVEQVTGLDAIIKHEPLVSKDLRQEEQIRLYRRVTKIGVRKIEGGDGLAL